MSRKQSRKDFRVDSLLSIVTNQKRIEAERNACPNNYLTVMFLGIYDKSMPTEQAAEVSVILSKISHMKRKDSFTKKQNRVSATQHHWPNPCRLNYFTYDNEFFCCANCRWAQQK